MTAKNNGTSGWVTYSDLDPMLAGYLYQLKSINKIESFKSKNAYHLVKVIGKRNTPFEEIKDKILMMLAQKARMDQFNTWIQVKRVQSDVKIIMTDYQKERVFLPENKTNAPKKKNVPVKKKP